MASLPPLLAMPTPALTTGAFWTVMSRPGSSLPDAACSTWVADWLPTPVASPVSTSAVPFDSLEAVQLLLATRPTAAWPQPATLLEVLPVAVLPPLLATPTPALTTGAFWTVMSSAEAVPAAAKVRATPPPTVQRASLAARQPKGVFSDIRCFSLGSLDGVARRRHGPNKTLQVFRRKLEHVLVSCYGRRTSRPALQEADPHGVRRLRPAVRAPSSSGRPTRNAEHKRIMRNVEIAKAADQNAFKYVWCPQHHFLDEYSPHARARGVPRPLLGHHRAGPPRLGDLQHHARRSTSRCASPRTSPSSTTSPTTASSSAPAGAARPPRCYGFDIADINETKAMWREAIAEIPKMWKDGHVLLRGQVLPGARARGVPQAPRPRPPRHVGGRRLAPAPSARPAELGLGAFCFTTGAPEPAHASSSRATRTRSASATPVGDYVNDNIMGVTNMLCMEDRKKAFEVAVQHGHELLHVARVPLARQHPEARRAARSGRTRSPSPRPRQVEQMAAEGFVVVGDPDDCARGVQRGSTWASTSSPSAPPPTRCPPRSSCSRWSCSAARSSRSSTRTRCTPPPATASGRVAASSGRMALPELHALAAEVSNWGRWGDDDELGTLNLIDDAAVAARRRGGAHRRCASRWPSASTPTARSWATSPGASTRCTRWSRSTQPTRATPPTPASATTPITIGLQAVHPLGRPRPRELRRAALQRLPGRRPSRPTAARRAAGIHKVTSVVSRAILLDVARAKGVDELDAAATRSPRPTSRRRWSWPACGPSRATSCSSAPGRCAYLKARDRAELHARRPARASPSARSAGCAATTSPPWPSTRSPWRCTRARTRPCCSRCT